MIFTVLDIHTRLAPNRHITIIQILSVKSDDIMTLIDIIILW